GHEAAGVVLEAGDGVTALAPGDHVVVCLIRDCGACRACRAGEPTQCLDGSAAASPLRRAGGRALAQGMRCGAFADEVVVDATQAVRVPPELSFTTACLLGCAVLTGMGAVERVTRVQPGDAVAVVGAGGVGLNAVQGAALAGAASIIALDVSPGRL